MTQVDNTKTVSKKAASYFHPAKSIVAKELIAHGRDVSSYQDKDFEARMTDIRDATMHVFKARNDYQMKSMVFVSKTSIPLLDLATTLSGGSLVLSGIKLGEKPNFEYSCAKSDSCYFSCQISIKELGDVELGKKKAFYVDGKDIKTLSGWMKSKGYTGYKRAHKDYIIPLYVCALEVKYWHKSDCFMCNIIEDHSKS